MPTWWGKKSTKSKDLESRGGGSSSSGGGGGSSSSGGVLHFNFNKSPIRNGYYKPENPNDGLNFRNSPRSSRDFTPSSDSIGLPLPQPRPSVSSTQSFSNDQGNTITFGSASVSAGSSISSNASSDDPSISNSQIITARFVL
jgi:mitogen-activated protein kinase kinase kinase 3